MTDWTALVQLLHVQRRLLPDETTKPWKDIEERESFLKGG